MGARLTRYRPAGTFLDPRVRMAVHDGLQEETGDRTKLDAVLIVFVLIILLMRVYLAFVREVNWDEFLNLSMVYDFRRGDMHQAFQTIFVHGFGWLSFVSSNEVDQIVAARLVMLACGGATAFFLFAIARKYVPFQAALFAVICYLSFSFVLTQANSFRTDQIALFCVMMALWIQQCWSRSWVAVILVGVLIGLAGMVTIKSIFHMPMIGLLWLITCWRAEDRIRAFAQAAASVLVALATLACLFALHYASLAEPESGFAFLQRTTGKTMGEGNLHHLSDYFVPALPTNIVFWVLLFVGVVWSMQRLFSDDCGHRIKALALLAFSAPLATLLLYSEAFPYFYPFLLAPVAILCGAGMTHPILSHAGGRAVIASVLFFLFSVHVSSALAHRNNYQRQLISVIHEIFPKPTPYIDRSSMVSTYPKKGFFMSRWGMAIYYEAGKPIMADIMRQDQPKFLVANREMLYLDDYDVSEAGPQHANLFKQDMEVLRDNFVHHWGALYVLGKALKTGPHSEERAFEIYSDGPYTLEGAGQLMIDGALYTAGDVVKLTRGGHRYEGRDGEQQFILRWGEHLYRPSDPAPDQPVFRGF